MFALVDGNSFYASCEKIFRPEWRNRPVVVLSNNDGCIVARCPIAKSHNVPDLLPYFQVRDQLESINAIVCSSNYELYGDISHRMMTTLGNLCGDVEVYSIDEAFLQLPTHIKDLNTFARLARQTVLQNVKMPNCVGIAPSKTLAKLANKTAKKLPRLNGVCVLDTPTKWEWVLKRVETKAIWGIGSRISERLMAMGIYTALDLAMADPKHIRKQFSVNVERTMRELNGLACLQLEDAPPPKKEIICSRSFGHKIRDVVQLQQSVAKYADRACQKLRDQDGLTATIVVHVQSLHTKPGYYWKQKLIKLDHYTNDSRTISQAAVDAVPELFAEGVAFHKAGVMLLDLRQKKPEQLNFFQAYQSEPSQRLMATMDRINRKYGRGTVILANQGIDASWNMRRERKSPCYTTRLHELPVFAC
jgi:DNA polymerase V